MTAGAIVAGIAIVIGAGTIHPAFACAVALAGAFLLAALRDPALATPVVLFILYTNLAVVAVHFHGVPAIVAAVYPGLLALPLLDHLLVRRERWHVDAIGVWILVFLAVQIAGTAFSDDPSRSFGQVRGLFFEGVVLHLLVIHVVRTPTELRRAVTAIVLAAAFVAIVPTIQQLTGDFSRTFGGLGQVTAEDSFSTGSGAQLRLAGSIGEKNRFSQNLLMAVPIGWWLASATPDRARRFALFAATGLAFLGFALAFSRGNAIAAVLTLGMMVVLRLVPRGHLVKIGLAGLLLFAILPQYGQRILTVGSLRGLVGGPVSSSNSPDGSFRRRAEVMVGAGLMFVDHPVIGVGPGMSPPLAPQYANALGLRKVETERQTHNLLLHIAAENGALGLTAFVAMLATAVLGCLRTIALTRRSHPEIAAIATGLLGALLVYFNTGLFLHLSYVRFFFVILALAAATIAIGRRVATEGAREGAA